jgi:hypothetical protein
MAMRLRLRLALTKHPAPYGKISRRKAPKAIEASEQRVRMPKQFRNDHPLVVFKPSTIHGIGGFARVDMRRGRRIIEYVGVKISKAQGQVELNKQNVYIFTLDEDYDVDGSVAWNAARFLNHSCAPNCEATIGRGRIWIAALRPIKAGEELTYNYSYDLEGYADRPCHCGAPTCVGYMVAEACFDTLRQRQLSRVENPCGFVQRPRSSRP